MSWKRSSYVIQSDLIWEINPVIQVAVLLSFQQLKKAMIVQQSCGLQISHNS